MRPHTAFDRPRRALPRLAFVLALHLLALFAFVSHDRIERPRTPQTVMLLTLVAPQIAEPPPPPPPPPPGVPELEKRELKGSLRQRMEQHRENAMCASCHARMDPIGFAFEHFDGIGKFRENDEGSAIEPAGELNTGEKFNDHQAIIKILAESRRADFLRCLTEKTLTYALGRGLEYYDRPAVEKIIDQTSKEGLQFSALIRNVAASVPFELRRGDGDPNQLRADVR